MAVFCVVVPYSLVEVYRRFRGSSHLHTRRRENLKFHKFTADLYPNSYKVLEQQRRMTGLRVFFKV
jgi:hypothetical protein